MTVTLYACRDGYCAITSASAAETAELSKKGI